MSHPIPLHSADGPERIIDEMRRCLRSRGDEGWLAQILMVLIFRELNRFLDILEDLLAKVRAGTLTIARRLHDGATPAARREPAGHATAAPSQVPADTIASHPRSAASQRIRAPRIDDPQTDARERSAVPAPPCPGVIRLSPRRGSSRPETAPRGGALHPSAVPRRTVQDSSARLADRRLSMSLRKRNNMDTCSPAPAAAVRKRPGSSDRLQRPDEGSRVGNHPRGSNLTGAGIRSQRVPAKSALRSPSQPQHRPR